MGPCSSEQAIHHAGLPSGKAPEQVGLGCAGSGVWGEWNRPYLTLDPAYEAAQLRVFGRMVARGHVYRGRKPVHWSPSSQTALAEAVRAAGPD